ncbi:hypothetical protein [Rufibacter psychrotolerans]|uniref:hypothetical protein n=1 Tax=Rufibacter psychrotolerans TaxID=2812556 RepID=UPI0019670B2F|nr:hypothetical protein [Rufibacter sp. SYSU D00308]
MKVIVLLFAMCIGSGLALKDALSGLNYKQEVIYINQTGKRMPAPTAEANATACSFGTAGKVTFSA